MKKLFMLTALTMTVAAAGCPTEDRYTAGGAALVGRFAGQRFLWPFVLPLAAAPRLVLCSDGISGMLDHEQMRQVLATSSDPALAADALLAAALDAGGRANATVVVVDSSPAAGDDTHSDLDLEQRLGALP